MKDQLGLPKKPSFLTVSIVLAIISVLTIFTLLAFSFYNSGQNNELENQIIIKDADSESVKQITELLNHQNIETKTQYYSESLDLKFTYDLNLVNIYEDNSSISFTLKDQKAKTVLANLKVIDKTANDPISNRAAYYESLYDGVKKDEEGTVEQLPYAKLSFVQANPFNNSLKAVVNKLIVYRAIDEGYIYAEITYPENYGINQISSSFANLLNSLELHPEDKSIVEIESEESKTNSTDLTVDKEEIFKYSVTATLFNKTCIDIKVEEIEGWESLSSKEYKNICSIDIGNGFFISGDGKILTKGDFATPNPIDVLLTSYWDTNLESDFWTNYLDDISIELEKNEIRPQSKDELFLSVIPILIELDDQQLITFESHYTNYLKQQIPFNIVDRELTNPDAQIETELLASKSLSKYLSNYNKSIGKTETNQNNISIIKALNSNITNYPAISPQSTIIVNAFSGSDILKLLSDNKIDLEGSTVSTYIKDGIGQMSKQYFSIAAQSFKSALKIYPALSDILNPLIEVSEEEVKKGNDKVIFKEILPFEDFLDNVIGFSTTSMYTVILVVAIGIFSLSSLAIIVISGRKNREAKAFTPPVVGNQSITPMDEEPKQQVSNNPMIQQVPPIIGNPNTDSLQKPQQSPQNPPAI